MDGDKPAETVAPISDEKKKYYSLYEDEAEAQFAFKWIDAINDALVRREQNSIVFNGLPYSTAYEYNIKKAVNYAPPLDPKDDREVSFGLPHEKIISFCAIFLKYCFKRRVKCYDKQGNLIDGVGQIYDLAIEHSQKLEGFKKLIALIYWEIFTQGNAFVVDEWQVTNVKDVIPMKDGQEITPDIMDYTYEFLDSLEYKEGETVQIRKAVSRLLDGRQVIFFNNEINEVQDQSTICIEAEYTRAEAEKMFGSLKMWAKVPKSKTEMEQYIPNRWTLFNESRLQNPENVFIVHYLLSKDDNLYNIYVQGVKMLPSKTPFRLFYPRGNYNLTNFNAERMTGSIYSRAVPAKTKFNADFLDWSLKVLADKFEQGAYPAILTKGRYTLTRDMFRGGQVTHGVSKGDYEKADPDNKGVTAQEFSFVGFLKNIVESQTVNATTSGELSSNATATEIATLDQNQRDKLGYLLDSLINGFTDLYMRRAETIEAKYTMKRDETIVDGKTVPVYQNFTVSMSGVQHSVTFDEATSDETYDTDAKNDELFTRAFKEKKDGKPSEYHIVDPRILREGRYNIDIEVYADKVLDTQLQMMKMWDEFGNLLKLFPDINRDEMKKIYLETTNRPDTIFQNPMGANIPLPPETAGAGAPSASNAVKDLAVKL